MPLANRHQHSTSNLDKPEKKRSHAKPQSREENLQPTRNPKNAISYQQNPKIDEKPQSHHS